MPGSANQYGMLGPNNVGLNQKLIHFLFTNKVRVKKRKIIFIKFKVENKNCKNHAFSLYINVQIKIDSQLHRHT